MKAIAQSLFSVFLGWLIPFVGYLCVMQFGPGFGYITDFTFLLFWPLLFTLGGWCVVGIALAVALARKEPFSIVISIGWWTLATTASFLLLAAMLRFGLLSLIWWPVTMGIIAGAVFWLRRHRGRRVPAWALVAIPILFLPCVRYGVIPIGIRIFPYATHVLAEGAIGNEALLNVMDSVKVGDTYENLHRA